MVDIGTGSHGDLVFFCIAVCHAVLLMRIAAVCDLKGITLIGVYVYFGQVAPFPEGVRLHDKTAVCFDFLIVGDVVPCHHVGVAFEPVFIESVNEKFITVKTAFPCEKHFESLTVALSFGVLITAAKDVHTLLPWEIFGNTAVAVKEVVCDNDTVIAKIFVK